MKHKRSAGFTLVEMCVVIGIMLIFLGFITVNLASHQRRVNLSTSVESLIADLRLQQIKAMMGDSETGSTASDYGIYFSPTAYTLFRGSSYSASGSSNFVISLEPGLQFSNAGQTILFSRFTGEVGNYSPSQNTIVILDANNNLSRTIEFNQYGVPVSLTK